MPLPCAAPATTTIDPPPAGDAAVLIVLVVPALLALLAMAGLIAGQACAARLRPARYRLPGERCRPARAVRWPPWALAAAFPALGWELWPRPGPAAVAVFLAAAVWLACLSAVDLDVHRLPDALTLPAYAVVPVALAASHLAGSGVDAAAPARAAGGGLLLGGLYLAVYGVGRRRGGLGLGDVKLAAPLGMLLGWLGWPALAVGAYAGFVASGLVGAATLWRRRGGRHTPHAHGPPMALGALAGVLLGG